MDLTVDHFLEIFANSDALLDFARIKRLFASTPTLLIATFLNATPTTDFAYCTLRVLDLALMEILALLTTFAEMETALVSQ